MDSTEIIFVSLAAVLALLWVFVWGPRAKVARPERERLAAEEQARQQAELAKLKEERDAHLKSIRSKAPDFIWRAKLEFERDYRAKGGDLAFGQEMSPLVCFGYRVGKTNGRTQTERRAILEYSMAADLDTALPFLPANYRNEWGQPLSVTRFNRMHQHLSNLADLREGRRNFEVAVANWRNDASWFQKEQRPIVEKYRVV